MQVGQPEYENTLNDSAVCNHVYEMNMTTHTAIMHSMIVLFAIMYASRST